MRQRTRKLVGVALLLIALVAYVTVAVAIYLALLSGQPTALLMLYFAVAGLGWLLPAMLIIAWMSRPDTG